MNETAHVVPSIAGVRSRPRRILAGALLALLAAGCAQYQPLGDAELAERITRQKEILRAHPPAAETPLSLDAAIVRALAFNLDLRVAALEAVITRGNVDLSEIEKLPHLALTAGYNRRDRPSGVNTDTVPGQFERHNVTRELSWGIIDFGLAWVHAQQDSNNALIAEDRRRRMANQIINEVRAAFWQVALGHKRLEEIRAIEADIGLALERSRKLAEAQLQDPLVSLNYQDGLVELRRQIHAYRSEVAQAEARLARLLNLPQGVPLLIADQPRDSAWEPLAELDQGLLEDMALISRSELHEADYTLRNRRLDVIRAYVQMVPTLRLRLASQYDNNNTLNFNRWTEYGGNLTLDLLSMFSAYQRAGQAKQIVALADLRRLVIAMAVTEQVSISLERVGQLARDYELSRQSTAVRDEIYRIRSNRLPYEVSDELERTRAAVSTLSARLREDRAYVQLQGAYGDLLAAVGVGQIPEPLELDRPERAELALARYRELLPEVIDAAVRRVRAAEAAAALPAAAPAP